jgi:hypothetical protein
MVGTMIRQIDWFRCLVILLLWHGAAFAQDPSVDPPRVGRPTDFSNVVGKYEIAATASPTIVAVEQPIILRVTITGAGPSQYEPKREQLKIFPDTWDGDFYREEMREEHQVDRAKKTWTFVYRLKPKHVKIDAIDGIVLVYFDPQKAGIRKFETRYADSIKITVKPRPENPPGIVLPTDIAPESFYQFVPMGEFRRSAEIPASFSLLTFTGFLAAVPMVCMLGACFWKKCHPDEREQRRRQRSRAADHALAQLRGQTSPVWQIVSQFLRERFDLVLLEPTPAEVAAILLRRGIARELCLQSKTLLQACDAQRYSRAPAADQQSLAEAAQRVIAALEADPCAR